MLTLKKLLLTLLMVLAGQTAGAEPLDPTQAFRFSARVLDAHTIEAHWQIADGYYMYRDKFRFETDPISVKLGTPQFPPGKIKTDENFGPVETYHDGVTIRLPVEAAEIRNFTLKVRSQGCADIGICYPPIAQQATIALPLSNTTTSTSPSAKVTKPDAPRLLSTPTPPPQPAS
jgi:thiol:disulfide interchange protein DsbD